MTDAPDSAYEICSKYAPNCDDTSSVLTTNKGDKKTSKKSKDKRKSKSSNKSRKAIENSELSSSFANSEMERNLRQNRQRFSSQDNSVELESASFGFNGEDDYYDSLNSGNEEGVFGTDTPILSYNPGSERPYDNDFNENQETVIENGNVSDYMI